MLRAKSKNGSASRGVDGPVCRGERKKVKVTGTYTQKEILALDGGKNQNMKESVPGKK